MKKRFNLITVIVLMALTGLSTYVVTFSWTRHTLNSQLESYSRQRQEFASFFEALEIIDRD